MPRTVTAALVATLPDPNPARRGCVSIPVPDLRRHRHAYPDLHRRPHAEPYGGGQSVGVHTTGHFIGSAAA